MGIVAGTVPPFQSDIATVPNLAGAKPQTTWNATLDSENGKNTGRHSVVQMNELFLNRGMTFGQIRSIISLMDNNGGDLKFLLIRIKGYFQCIFIVFRYLYLFKMEASQMMNIPNSSNCSSNLSRNVTLIKTIS
jgi:hypothetical protein